MALSPRVHRRERIDALCVEVDDLVQRYSAMPPGKPQLLVATRIEKKLREIDHLNEPHFFEKPFGHFLACAIGSTCVLVGAVIGSYGTITFGIFILAVCLMGGLRSTYVSDKNRREWGQNPS